MHVSLFSSIFECVVRKKDLSGKKCVFNRSMWFVCGISVLILVVHTLDMHINCGEVKKWCESMYIRECSSISACLRLREEV